MTVPAPSRMVVETPQSRCRAGVARVDITPPIGIYHRMWGAAMHDRAEAVHKPLFATALWLEPLAPARVGSPQVVIAMDHCVLDAEEMLKLRGAVAKTSGAPLECVSISLSHTHGSAWMSRSRAELPGGDLIGPYLDELAGQLAELAGDAEKSVANASITYGQGRCSLAAHRDLWDPDAGRFVCGFHPEGPADDTLIVARITNNAGNVRAVIVNYACHPTTLAWDNRAISPDWIGAMRETIESITGGICMFLQGASGDLGPREGFVGDWNVADRNGRQLAYAAAATLEALPDGGTRYVYAGPVVSGTTIGTWKHEPLDDEALAAQGDWKWEHHNVPLAYRPDLPTMEQTLAELERLEAEEKKAHVAGESAREKELHALVEQMRRQRGRLATLPAGRTYPFPVKIGKLGDALWVFVPAELYQIFQIALRQRFAPRPVIVSTLTDDWQPGYIPQAASYGYGIYQDVIAAVAPGALETLIEATSRHISAMLRSV